ncbi:MULTISPECIES: AAA family ATPase [Acidiphilium]|uniref:AAA family ATPase n=1 Tax=Acidiphilium TaxID=522 RepID=UPI00157BB077|nr:MULTISPECIES: AAA family ATPase [Acidiphilium]
MADEAISTDLAIQGATAQLGLLTDAAQKARRAVERAVIQRETLEARGNELRTSVGEAKGRLEIRDAVTATLERIQTEALESTVGVYTRLLTALVQDVIDADKEIAIDLGIERGQPALSISSFVKGAPDYKTSVFENSGAMTNVVCAGLRCISVVRSGGRRLLVLDEPDCWIRGDRVEAFYRVLRGLCRDIGFQIVVVSHHRPEMFGTDSRVITLGRDDAAVDFDGPAEDEPAKPVRRRGSKKPPPPDARSLRTAVIREMAGGTRWQDVPAELPGIRKIEIRNLATLKDIDIELDPYLTVITGDVDIGKSRVTRAFRAIFYGDVTDDDIRHGETGMAIMIEAENRQTLRFSRETKRNPVNQWTMLDADGETMTHDGQICSTGGRMVPDWVCRMMGIVRTDDLDLQIGHQKKPIFLLDLPATRQAAVLSIGQEVQWLRAMQTKYRERIVGWNQQVKSGEAEMGNVVARLEAMADVATLSERAEKAAQGLSDTAEKVASIRLRASISSRLRELAATHDRLAAVTARLETLPHPPEIPPASEIDIRRGLAARIADGATAVERIARVLERLGALPEAPVLTDVSFHHAAASSLRSLRSAVDRGERISAILARLPAEAPALRETDGAEVAALLRGTAALVAKSRAALERLSRLPGSPEEKINEDRGRSDAMLAAAQSLRLSDGHVSGALARLREVDEQIVAARYAFDQLVAEVGDLCPVCGGPMHEDEDEPTALIHESRPVAPVVAQPVVVQPMAPSVSVPPPEPSADDAGFSLDLGF